MTPLKEKIVIELIFVEEAIDYLARHNCSITNKEQRAVTCLQDINIAKVLKNQKANTNRHSHWLAVRAELAKQGISWFKWQPPLQVAGMDVEISRDETIRVGCATIPFSEVEAVHEAIHKDDIPF